jgi:hypothetical protein
MINTGHHGSYSKPRPERDVRSGRLGPDVRNRAGKPLEALRLGLLEFFVLFTEPFDAAGRVDQLLFAGKKRMALGTNLHRNVFPGRTDFEFSAAVARYFRCRVRRVNVFFHAESLTSEYFKNAKHFWTCKKPAFKRFRKKAEIKACGSRRMKLTKRTPQ